MAPGEAATRYVIVNPDTQATTPSPIARYMVRENECETSWAMATGTIMTAETSRAPTTRMDTELSLIHISEPTRPLYISYAVFCLKK